MDVVKRRRRGLLFGRRKVGEGVRAELGMVQVDGWMNVFSFLFYSSRWLLYNAGDEWVSTSCCWDLGKDQTSLDLELTGAHAIVQCDTSSLAVRALMAIRNAPEAEI